MTKYKIEAKENVRLDTLDKNLSAGNSITIEDPVNLQMSEFESLERSGFIRFVELEETTIRTVEDNDDTDENETEEIEENDDVFECPNCGKNYESEYWFEKHLEDCKEED